MIAPMYGMVNKAVEDMVCKGHGEEAWERIKELAGVDVDVFITNESYPDETTYRLVAAASQLLKVPASQILEAFGEHWVLETAREGYGSLLDAGGRNLTDFLINLPNFHTRVAMIFPHLQPPRFKVTEATEHSLQLHYYTHRAGLAPFVVGLLRGLGRKFNTPLRAITVLGSREQGADHETFLVEW